MVIMQNSNGNGQSYATKVMTRPYVILVDNDEEMKSVLEHSLELKWEEHLKNDGSHGESDVAKGGPELLNKFSLMRKNAAACATPLSYRQTEILKGAAKGHPNKLIAHDLGISEHTVSNHLRSINTKMMTNDRTHAVVLAIRNGWLGVE